ncbi:hypothetical protein HK405_001475, partial [Cladochytrium tenue]
ADQYLVGAVLLGGAPCTAMVFVWSKMMAGDPTYTLTQVAVNDLLLLAIYGPIVKLLSGDSSASMPWSTLLFSVGLYVLAPLLVSFAIRGTLAVLFDRARARHILTRVIIPALDKLSAAFLIAMVVLLFVSQAASIGANWVDMLAIAVPLLLQTFLIWGLTYAIALWVLRLPYDLAGPATLIACSNFFEMAVALAVSLYGADSEAALATVVGVLIEVPVMVLLVWINNRTKHFFPAPSMSRPQ